MHTREQAAELVRNTVGSLEDLCKQAICTADINLMLAMGFPEKASRVLCGIVTERAAQLGITDLEKHYRKGLETGAGTIINTLVRKFHKVYFATRSNLHPMVLLDHLESASKEDLCVHLYTHSMEQAPAQLATRRKVVMERRLKRAMAILEKTELLDDTLNISGEAAECRCAGAEDDSDCCEGHSNY